MEKREFSKKWLKYLLRLVITSFIIILLINSIGISSIFDSIKQVNMVYLLIAWVIALFVRFLESTQMKRLMKEAAMDIPAYRTFLAGSLSALYGMILPGDLLAGVAKWANLSSAVGEKAGVFNSIIYFRLLQLMPWLVAGIIAFAINNPTDSSHLPIILGILSSFIIIVSIMFYHPKTGMRFNAYASKVVLFLFPHKIADAISNVLSSLKYFYEFHWSFHLIMMIRSFFIMIIGFVGFYFSAMAVGIDLPIAVLVWAKSIITLSRQLPITISGLGVRESILVTVFMPFAVPEASAFTLGMLMFSNSVIYALIGAVYQLFLAMGWAKWSLISDVDDPDNSLIMK